MLWTTAKHQIPSTLIYSSRRKYQNLRLAFLLWLDPFLRFQPCPPTIALRTLTDAAVNMHAANVKFKGMMYLNAQKNQQKGLAIRA